jgi:hypothetical protein
MNISVVESATLASVGYDAEHMMLRLEFRSHAVYNYAGVPRPVYEGLLAASSKGRYFNRAIRGHFPHSRVAEANCGQQGEA